MYQLIAGYCNRLAGLVRGAFPTVDVEVTSMSNFDAEDLSQEDIVVFIISTYTDGQPPEHAKVNTKIDFISARADGVSKLCHNILIQSHMNSFSFSTPLSASMTVICC